MPARFEDSQPDLSRLQSQLLVSGLQQRDNPTFQVIDQLITATKRIQGIINADVTLLENDLISLSDLTFLTKDDESLDLPNSRRVLAGTGITFDDTIVNIRTISATPHALLDGIINNDTVAQAPTRGSLIYGNITPKWDELVIGAANRLLRSDGTDVSWSQAVLTTDVTGILPIVNGGTNSVAIPTNGGLAYGTGTAYAFSAAGVLGDILKSAGAATPTWNTPAALTKVDDTNVTLTLGGSSTTALVNAASITAGWTGTLAAARLNSNVVQSVVNDTNVTGSIATQVLTLGWAGVLSVARGGTGLSSAFTAGSVIFSNGSTFAQDNANFFWDDTNKRLGIGTTGPTHKLDIAATGTANLRLTDSLNSVQTLITAQSGLGFIGTLTNTTMQIGANSLGVINITGPGNVGIGTMGPFNNEKLSVVNTSAGATTVGLNLVNNSSSANTAVTLDFTPNPNIPLARITSFRINAGGTSHLSFGVGAENPPGERMRITDTGNVGINTTSPYSTFGGVDISSGGLSLVLGADNGASSRTNTTNKLARIAGFHFTNAEEPIGMFVCNSFVNGTELFVGGGSSLVNAPTKIFFNTAANNTTLEGTSRMTIDSSGNIGIVTTTPNSFLSIVTSSNTSQGMSRFVNTRTTDDDSSTVFSLRVGVVGTGTNARFIDFRSDSTSDTTGTTQGRIRLNNNAVAYDTTSDARLKENIFPTLLGIDTLMGIKIRDFNFISDYNKTRRQGFIAQELYQIYPEAVSVGGENPEENPWSVEYGRLTPLIISSIQELTNQIAKYQLHISELRERIKLLEVN